MKPLPKLLAALACYAALGISATLTLDGKMRAFLWIFLGALAFKTWLGYYQSRIE